MVIQPLSTRLIKSNFYTIKYALFIYVLFAGETKFSVVQGVHPLTPPTEATIVEHVLVLSLYYCVYLLLLFSHQVFMLFMHCSLIISNLWAWVLQGKKLL